MRNLAGPRNELPFANDPPREMSLASVEDCVISVIVPLPTRSHGDVRRVLRHKPVMYVRVPDYTHKFLP